MATEADKALTEDQEAQIKEARRLANGMAVMGFEHPAIQAALREKGLSAAAIQEALGPAE